MNDATTQQANPMQQMMQMMTMMAGQMDSTAQPFQIDAHPDEDSGLESEIIRPINLPGGAKVQEALSIQPLLDKLCLTEDGKNALGGVPKGSTITLTGPPGGGKTRSALESLIRVAATGTKCVLVVAEEGFVDDDSGRDDLRSRIIKLGMKVLDVDEDGFKEKVEANYAVINAQYHRGQTWADFIGAYRYLVEKDGIKFAVIDSITTLDPTNRKTIDNLSALKTYNHGHGVTCLVIGQVKDTGQPAGGKPLQHTSDVVFHIDTISMGSKEIAAKWDANYRDNLTVIRVLKSNTTPIFSHPVRIHLGSDYGTLEVHPDQPDDKALLDVA